jgi:hypothetical protein
VPMLQQAFRVRKCRVGGSWQMDGTYVRIRGKWKYLHRAVDKAGNTVGAGVPRVLPATVALSWSVTAAIMRARRVQ